MVSSRKRHSTLQWWEGVVVGAIGTAVVLHLLGSPRSVEGTWSGLDSDGKPITLTFGPGRSFSAGEDLAPMLVRMEYEAIPELEPPQLWVRLLRADSVGGRIPLGTYKIEGGRLIICEAGSLHRAILGVPIGTLLRHEWPKTFSGDCLALDRQHQGGGSLKETALTFTMIGGFLSLTIGGAWLLSRALPLRWGSPAFLLGAAVLVALVVEGLWLDRIPGEAWAAAVWLSLVLAMGGIGAANRKANASRPTRPVLPG